MIISLIVAMDRTGCIGKDGGLPWRLSADLKLFKRFTMGHHLIVGRKTWETIGRPLPGRRMIVLTHQREYAPVDCPDCAAANSLEDALNLARAAGENEVFIGGGGEIFTLGLPYADRIYWTEVHTSNGCDVYFPEVNFRDWVEVARMEQTADDRNEFPFTFHLLERVKADKVECSGANG